MQDKPHSEHSPHQFNPRLLYKEGGLLFADPDMNRRGQLDFGNGQSPLSTIPETPASKSGLRVDEHNQVIVSPKTGAFFAVIVLLSFIFVMAVACTAMLGVNVGMQNSQSSRLDEILNKTL